MHTYPIGNGTVSSRIPGEVAALLDALQLEGSNTDALLALDDADWQRLLEFCDLAHLALPLSQVSTAGFPKWVLDRLEQNVRDNSARFERLKAAYIEAAAGLERADISYLVLKGFTQAPNYVADPRLRMQSDIDIYCAPEYVEKAQSTLIKLGYRPVEKTHIHADHIPALIPPGEWKWRGNPYDPDMPPGIEVHFCFWNQRASLVDLPEVDRFWDRRVMRRLENIQFYALHPVDQLGYFAIHILRGVLSGDWVIHHVHELATFLHHHMRDVEFWSRWHETHSADLRSKEAVAFSLARKWFSCILPEVLRMEVDSLPPGQKRWLDRYAGAPLEAMFRHNKDGRLLQILLARSRTARRSVLHKVMLPSHWPKPGAVLRKIMLPSHWPKPGAPAVRIRYRRAGISSNGHPLILYLRFLATMALASSAATVSFFLHGVSLWLSTRALSACRRATYCCGTCTNR